MVNTAEKKDRNRWQWALSTIVTLVLTGGAWLMGATKADTASATEIAAIKDRQSELDRRIDQKVSKEEFQQFTKGLDARLALIQTNTELIVKMQKRDRK